MSLISSLADDGQGKEFATESSVEAVGTVLLADTSDFMLAVGKLEGRDLNRVVENACEIIVPIIHESEGIICELIGNRFLAIWNEESTGQNLGLQAKRAFQASCSICASQAPLPSGLGMQSIIAKAIVVCGELKLGVSRFSPVGKAMTLATKLLNMAALKPHCIGLPAKTRELIEIPIAKLTPLEPVPYGATEIVEVWSYGPVAVGLNSNSLENT